jgi:DIL domain-containing protein
MQVGMNLSVLEEWIETANLPRGILSHLAPVRDLLNWIQVRYSLRPCCRHAQRATPGTVLVLYHRVF